MTKAEAIKYIEENAEGLHYNGMYRMEEPVPEGIKEIEEVEQVGGEGMGDHYHVVFKVTLASSFEPFYVLVNAHYNSWDGTDWSYSDVNEVVPYEKTVRAWKVV